MKKFITNPYFKKGLPGDNGIDPVSTDVEAVKKLLSLCPKAAETPLVESVKLSHELGIKKLWFKDESCLLYTSPSPRDISGSRMPSSA